MRCPPSLAPRPTGSRTDLRPGPRYRARRSRPPGAPLTLAAPIVGRRAVRVRGTRPPLSQHTRGVTRERCDALHPIPPQVVSPFRCRQESVLHGRGPASWKDWPSAESPLSATWPALAELVQSPLGPRRHRGPQAARHGFPLRHSSDGGNQSPGSRRSHRNLRPRPRVARGGVPGRVA
jgi:hypothetical protein